MDSQMVDLIQEQINDEESLIIFKQPNLIHFRTKTRVENNFKLIEIYKSTERINTFYLLPIVEKILEKCNIESYNIEITFFDELEHLCLLKAFLYAFNRVFNISCFAEISKDGLKVIVDNTTVYHTNIIYNKCLT